MSEPKKLKSENKMLKLQEDEYQLEMSLYDNNSIEFKVTLNSALASCYYMENYDLETIVEISLLLLRKYKDMEAVYQYYKVRILSGREMNLVLSPDKNIMSLKYQKIVDDVEIDVELKLKKKMAEKDDIVQALMKEIQQLKKTVVQHEKKIDEQLKKKDKYYEEKIDELKKNNDLLMEEIKKMKEKEKEEEKIKFEDKKNEEIWKIEEEKFSSLNDNVNLTNNFKFENFPELKFKDSISSCGGFQPKTVAVYCMIKNNERLYQMAYCKNKYYSQTNCHSNIIIYNLVSNKIENKIYYIQGVIETLKHYYNSKTKNHILLSFSRQYNSYDSTTLWNISSNPIMNILHITNCCDKPCLVFKNVDYFIFGRKKAEKNSDYSGMCFWDKNGSLINRAKKSNLYNLRFAEATYLENKNYILLSGEGYEQKTSKTLYFSECYNYDEDKIKTYKDDENENNSIIYCINLFKKGNDISLITGSYNIVNIFEFESTKLKTRIQLGDGSVFSLCSINEKYMIASNYFKLKIIDMENHSVIKEYSAHEDGCNKNDIQGIEKIKIPEKGEFIITYANVIKIWKI